MLNSECDSSIYLGLIVQMSQSATVSPGSVVQKHRCSAGVGDGLEKDSGWFRAVARQKAGGEESWLQQHKQKSYFPFSVLSCLLSLFGLALR